MYIDKEWSEKTIYPVSKIFNVEKDFKARCCDYIFKKGDQLRVAFYTSKKILFVQELYNGTGYHKIKKGNIINFCKERN